MSLAVVFVHKIAGPDAMGYLVQIDGPRAAQYVLEMFGADVMVILADRASRKYHYLTSQCRRAEQMTSRDINSRTFVVFRLKERLGT